MVYHVHANYTLLTFQRLVKKKYYKKNLYKKNGPRTVSRLVWFYEAHLTNEQKHTYRLSSWKI